MKQKIFLLLCGLSLFCSNNVQADPIFRINNGANATINKFSNCKLVTNSSATPIMVPTNTNAEWTAFLAHLPTNVTATTCVLPTWISSTETDLNPSSSNSLVLPKPSGLQAGDLLLVLIQDSYYNPMTNVVPPTGFQVLEGPYKSQHNISYYKVVNATDAAAANFTWTQTESFYNTTVFAHIFRNVNATTPITTHSFSGPSSGSSTVTYTSITTSIDNSLLVAMTDMTGGINGAPSGFTNNYSVAAHNLATKIQVSAGATGALTSTMDNSYHEWYSYLLALPPP